MVSHRSRRAVHTTKSRIGAVARTIGAIALLVSAPLAAQQPASAPGAESAVASADTAPLSVRGRTIVVFRAALGAVTPAERAAAAARRLDALAERSGADSVE